MNGLNGTCTISTEMDGQLVDPVWPALRRDEGEASTTGESRPASGRRAALPGRRVGPQLEVCRGVTPSRVVEEADACERPHVELLEEEKRLDVPPSSMGRYLID